MATENILGAVFFFGMAIVSFGSAIYNRDWVETKWGCIGLGLFFCLMGSLTFL